MKLLLSLVFAAGVALVGRAGETPKFELVSASYGAGAQRLDVIDLLSPLIAHGRLVLEAPWAFDNPDPAFGVTKDVIVVYRCGGKEQTAIFVQDQNILLPPPAEGLTILSASYGLPQRRIDVTNAVSEAVKDGAIRLPANWGLGRVDPAAGMIKTVEIRYLLDGAMRKATFSQKQELVLP